MTDWRDRALCAGVEGWTELPVADQKADCRDCPVTIPCLQQALDDEAGVDNNIVAIGVVYGGLTGRERLMLRGRRPATPSAPCGTPAAYLRHIRAGEDPDQACRDAAAAERATNRRRASRG